MGELTSIADALASGVRVEVHEAVAIVQQLIDGCAPDGVSHENGKLHRLQLCSDGTVFSSDGWGARSVLDAADLLDALLTQNSKARVPGALRYTLARAQLKVDAPPFATVTELSEILRRFEKGDRRDLLKLLYARTVNMTTPALAMERRRSIVSTTELRRHLREADQQLYLRQVSLEYEQSSPAWRWILDSIAAILISFGMGYFVMSLFT